jgi:hypothetical protein
VPSRRNKEEGCSGMLPDWIKTVIVMMDQYFVHECEGITRQQQNKCNGIEKWDLMERPWK